MTPIAHPVKYINLSPLNNAIRDKQNKYVGSVFVQLKLCMHFYSPIVAKCSDALLKKEDI